MASYQFSTSKDIYLEIDGKRLASVQSYTAKTTRESRYVEAFGSAEPVGTAGGRVRHVIQLSRIALTGSGQDVDLFGLEEFNLVIVKPDRKVIYCGCRWSSIEEDARLTDTVVESAVLMSARRIEVK